MDLLIGILQDGFKGLGWYGLICLVLFNTWVWLLASHIGASDSLIKTQSELIEILKNEKSQ